MPHTRLIAALTAPLVAIGLSLAMAPAAQAAHPETTITSGPEDGALVLPGPVQYTFTSDVGVATFQCSVDNAPYAVCTSPATYDLPPGGHIFRVRADDGMGGLDPTPPSRIWTVRNVPCEQAGAAYQVAQGKFFEWQNKLSKAKRKLHHARNHGTAKQFQQAKNKVRKIRVKIKKYKDAMNAATAQEAAVC